MKLKIHRSDKSIIDFINTKAIKTPQDLITYPETVRRYYPFLKQYIERIIIKRNPEIKVQPLNEVLIIVRFGDE
jgi:hypothetical protein